MSSIIKVDTIQLADGTAGTIENLGLATGALSHRNLIINGAMQVAQRGTQVTGITTYGYVTCDRIKTSFGSLGTWTADQSTDAPDGFSNSFKITCTTADSSPASGDIAMLQYKVEAQDLQHLAFGTSDAKNLTLSFYVKSNKTGSGSLDLRQIDAGKQFTAGYTISSADTWERKTISIPANTSDAIDNNNGNGFQFNFWINSGSNYIGGTRNSGWIAYTDNQRNADNLGVGGATSDYWAITGLQLEIGSVATPFEHRSYGEELARCQRYYQIFKHRIEDDNGASGRVFFYGYSFLSEMRTAPTQTTTYDNSSNVNTDQTHFRTFGGKYGFTQGIRETASGNCWAEITNTLDAEL